MADKRISQLIERTDIANNDVLPIVASGATTTNKVTVSTLQDWMQDNLDVGVTSVGLSVPSAFTVSGSPVTTSGNITISGAGTTAQYIRGDGSLADFPSSLGGGGASVSYYLNGSVSQGTIGGIAYREMNKTPIFGAGTDITISSNGYVASFITDAGDPALLEIPAGNWNFETYLSASSGGGSPTFYIELYKVNSGGTATLIASNSGTPESISLGTNINPYFSALAVPTTTLALTDRLAIRIYVTPAGRTITLHTENSHLCQIITTFTTGLTALNGLTAQVQNFATGTSGTDFNISSSSTTHTFNLPTASSTNRGALSSADWITFNGKQNAITLTTTGSSGAATLVGSTLNIPNYTTAMQNQYVPYVGAIGNVTLGANNMSASNVLVDGAATTSGGFLGFKQASSVATGQGGYTSISAIGTNEIKFSFAQPTNFKEFSFSTQSITAGVSGGRIYTLPDASGTLALTSNLSAYLPLTGGTLTGALNGTSAAFTGTLSAGQSTFTHADTPLRLNNAGGQFTQLDFQNNGTQKGAIWWNNSANSLNLFTGVTALSLASTGAATFSSSVTAVQGNFYQSASSGNAIQLRNRNSNQTWGLVVDTDAVDDKNLGFYTGSAYALRLNATSGSATFSSSVTANVVNTLTSGGFSSTSFPLNASLSSNASASSVAPVARFSNNGGGFVTKIMLSDNNRGDAFITHVAGSAFIPSSRWLGFGVDAVDQMVINASGNVGIGTASPSSSVKFNVFDSSANGDIALFSTDATKADIWLKDVNTSAGSVRLRSESNALVFNAGGNERMRITSTGTVGIGTSSPSSTYILDVHTNNSVYNTRFYQPSSSTSAYNSIIITGAMTSAVGYAGIGGSATGNTSFRDNFVVGTQSSHPLVLNTNDTERMRITSGGAVAIGATSTNGRLGVRGTTNDSSAYAFEAANSSGNSLSLVRNDGLIIFPSLVSTFTTGSAANMFVSPGDGAIYRSTSSIKYKKNVEDYDKGLTEVMQMRPVFYEGISESDECKIFAGLIAEEVHDLGLTEFVQYAEDGSPDSLAYQNMVALLIKAIQELKAEIDSLKTK